MLLAFLCTVWQDEYTKWGPCCSSSMNPPEFHGGAQMYGSPESIAMNQFPIGIPPSREHTLMASSSGGGPATGTTTVECNSPSGAIMRSPRSSSPLMGLGSPASLHRNPHHSHVHLRQHHPSCHTLHQQPIQQPMVQQQQSYSPVGGGSASGTLKKSHIQTVQQHQPPQQMPTMVIPDFIQTVFPHSSSNQCMDNGHEYAHDMDDGIPESAIRLYMNQVAGKMLIINFYCNILSQQACLSFALVHKLRNEALPGSSV